MTVFDGYSFVFRAPFVPPSEKLLLSPDMIKVTFQRGVPPLSKSSIHHSVEKAQKRSRDGNSYFFWKNLPP